jgi:hypothetical protein
MFYNEFCKTPREELAKREELKGYFNGYPKCSEVAMAND